MKQIDNFFIAQPPFVRRTMSKPVWFLNKVLKKLKLGYGLDLMLDGSKDMSNIEQRINYYHLLNLVIQYQVPGDVIELGSFTGQCALLFQKIIHQSGSSKKLHLYDTFEMKFALREDESVIDIMQRNMKNYGLEMPTLHKGLFQETIPAQLPEKVSFVHIDCGSGGDKIQHRDIVLYCLENVYPKMSKGAVCALMDYHDPTIPGNSGNGVNPGVKLAVDIFLSTRPEKMVCLYCNQRAHAYFIKQ